MVVEFLERDDSARLHSQTINDRRTPTGRIRRHRQDHRLAFAVRLAERTRPPSRRRCVLAGGLNPENVREAIDIIHPAAVDVASGIESSLE